MKPPVLPTEFCKIHPLATIAFVCYGLLLYVSGAVGAGYVINSHLPAFAQFLILVMAWFMAQQGLHLLGIMGHEGFHGNLHPNREYSAMLGTFFSSIVASYLVTGYALTHWKHHNNINKATDPDTQIYSRYHNFWSRLLLSRFTATRKYRQDTYKLAFGKPIDLDASPLKITTLRRLAQWNLFYAACWFTVYLSIFIQWPMVGFVSIVIPHILSANLSGLRVYIEHSGTSQNLLESTRSYTHPIYTLLFFGNNFHLEHHLYPHVPCYRLLGIHKWLSESGFFRNAGCSIDDSILSPWQYVFYRHQYPNGLEKQNSSLDYNN